MEYRVTARKGSWAIGQGYTCPTARRPVPGHPDASNETFNRESDPYTDRKDYRNAG